MVTEMKLVPHSHFGMPGSIQKHTLVYTVVAAMVLTVFFDLSRIASLGAIFYIVMDIVVQWGVLRHLRDEIAANAVVVGSAIVLDVVQKHVYKRFVAFDLRFRYHGMVRFPRRDLPCGPVPVVRR